MVRSIVQYRASPSTMQFRTTRDTLILKFVDDSRLAAWNSAGLSVYDVTLPSHPCRIGFASGKFISTLRTIEATQRHLVLFSPHSIMVVDRQGAGAIINRSNQLSETIDL